MDQDNDVYYNPQEYLDQIATKKTGRFMFINKKLVVLICAIILLFISLIIWALVSSSPKRSPASELLTVRLQNMATLLEYDSSKITDSQYKKVIAETKVVFASQNYQLSRSIALVPDSSLATKESISATIESLDKSSANNSLSKEYISALDEQLNSIISSLSDIQATSNSIVIEQAISDLTKISNRLSRN